MCSSHCLLKTVGSAFPFDLLSLSDSLSGIFEDDIFSFSHSFNPTSKVFQAVFLKPMMLCCMKGWGGVWWALKLAVVPH